MVLATDCVSSQIHLWSRIDMVVGMPRRANGVHGVGPLFDSLLTRWGWNEGWRLLSSVHSGLPKIGVQRLGVTWV